MDSHLFRLFAACAERLLTGARIEKIQEPRTGLLALACFGQHKKFQLLARFGKREPFFFVSHTRITANNAPSAQIMRLRRYFGQRKISAVVSQFCQRKLWLLASATDNGNDKAAWLCLDIMRGPSLHFLSAADSPIPDEPVWPEPAELENALSNWRAWPVLTPLLRKSLRTMEPPDRLALVEDLRAGGGDVFLYRNATLTDMPVVMASAWPIPCGMRNNLTEEAVQDPEHALAAAGKDLVLRAMASSDSERLVAPLKKRIKKLDSLLRKLEQDKARLEAMIGLGQRGAMLAANLWRLDGSAHQDFMEIEGVRIELDKKYSVRENMERFFHAAARGKRGLRQLEERRRELAEERKGLQLPQPASRVQADSGASEMPDSPKTDSSGQILLALQKRLPKNVAAALSSDGYILLRGKDAKGNSAARHFASPHDLWVHVQTGPGAHVIIRRRHAGDEVPESTLLEAGALAASKSWLSGATVADIMYAEVRHVKAVRDAVAGTVSIDRLKGTIKAPLELAARIRNPQASQG